MTYTVDADQYRSTFTCGRCGVSDRSMSLPHGWLRLTRWVADRHEVTVFCTDGCLSQHLSHG